MGKKKKGGNGAANASSSGGISADAVRYANRLQKMIQCATVSRKDSYEDTEFAKLREVVAELFPLVHQKAERLSFGEDCWLYRLEGKDSSRCVVLMSHHDVAPVTGEWKHPAFSGKIAGDRIWGRGTVDTKTSLFAEFSALEELIEEGFSFPCTVYLASSHNEEIAGGGIPAVVEYLRKNRIAIDFVLDEGGAVIEPPIPGISRKCAVLAVHEKGRHTLELFAGKNPEHSGLSANGETPAVRMARFMVRIQKEQPYIRRFSPELNAMFGALAPHMSFPLGFVFGHLKLFSGILKRVIPRLNPQAGAMLGTTGTFQNIATEKESGECSGELMLRCVNRQDLKTEIGRITAIAAEYGVKVKSASYGNEFHGPAERKGPAFAHVKRSMAKTFPQAIVMPFILPAGTDARHFSKICRHVYRFAPIDIDGQQFGSVHGVDENICLEAVPKAVEFYRTLIRDLQ